MDVGNRLIDAAVASRLEAAVTRLESRNDTEVVPILLPASDDYMAMRLAIALVATWVSGMLATVLVPPETISLATWQLALLVLFAIFFASSNIPVLLRWFLPEAHMANAVARRSLELFYRYRLHQTRRQNGILICISQLEHRVQILADQGIHQKVAANFWDDVVAQMLPLVKQGKVADAFELAMALCEPVLNQHFPKSTNDQNELPNRLIEPQD